jgi:iron complex outermembrane receptor protein
LTTTLATTGNRVATTWPKIDGTFLRQDTIILPVGHPDNPTNGTANSQPIQVIYRFEDLPLGDINTLKSLRFTAGFTGIWGDWDFDTALLYSRQDNLREQEGRLRSSLLNAAIANRTYRFGRFNDAAGQAAVASTAVNEGESSITSLDFRANRPVFALPGGDAFLAIGLEGRREELSAVPDATYGTGDYIGLVANGASGSRNVFAGFAELVMPVFKSLELQAALRGERYSDFGNSTTGKLGFKWTAVPSMVAFRGTAATGFRAPSISQIGDSFVLSFNNFQERRVIDPLRCDPATFTTLGGLVNVPRDCNVLNFSAVPAGTTTPGNMPTVVSANRNLKPEKSRSFTFGLLLEPYKDMDLALDAWYFERTDEIRVQRGVDVLTTNAPGTVVRDPNPATWLPGVANSGPIILLVREYGNYKWTRTSGIDYDWNIRLPATDYGKFSVKLQGTYTNRYDRLVLEGANVERLVGTSTIDIPKTRASLTLRWDGGDAWNAFLRHNHADPISTTASASCLNSANPTTTERLRREAGYCKVGHERTVDLGLTYKGIKGLSLSATVFNVANDYNRSDGFPGAFTYWDPGLQGQLGRRISIGANYTFW